MVFSSLVFLFVFLPTVIILTFASGKKFRNLVLVVFSLFFYAWGEGFLVLLMLASIIANYLFGILLDFYKKKPLSKLILSCAVICNLSLLIFYKYANFLVDIFNSVFSYANIQPILISEIHLPIGISFFTFQAISYVVDVYRGKSPAQKNLINLGLYISLFTQLIAGPIIRFHDISKQITARVAGLHDIAYGIKRFVVGLGKKVLIANTMAVTVDWSVESLHNRLKSLIFLVLSRFLTN